MPPLVSVCVPTCNGAAHIRQCMESLLNQTLSDLEVVISDDCSTDETVEMVEAFQREDDRIVLHRNGARLGIPANWSRTVELARGRWIKLMGQDDHLAAGCLAAMLQAGTEGGGLVIADRHVTFENVDEATHSGFQQALDASPLRRLKADRVLIPSEVSEMVLDNLDLNFIGEPVTALFLRSFLEELGPFDNRLMQFCDYEFFARIGVNRGLTWMAEPNATFRLHGSGQTANNVGSMRFRTLNVEAMLLLASFASRPHFAPLREAGLRRLPPLDLPHLAARSILHTQRLARKSGVDPSQLRPLMQDPMIRQVLSGVPLPERWLRARLERPRWVTHWQRGHTRT